MKVRKKTGRAVFLTGGADAGRLTFMPTISLLPQGRSPYALRYRWIATIDDNPGVPGSFAVAEFKTQAQLVADCAAGPLRAFLASFAAADPEWANTPLGTDASGTSPGALNNRLSLSALILGFTPAAKGRLITYQANMLIAPSNRLIVEAFGSGAGDGIDALVELRLEHSSIR